LERIIVYGRTVSSLSDKEMARKLNLRGHENIMILKGGLPVWKKKGHPDSGLAALNHSNILL